LPTEGSDYGASGITRPLTSACRRLTIAVSLLNAILKKAIGLSCRAR
jgi:hypothetical protein